MEQLREFLTDVRVFRLVGYVHIFVGIADVAVKLDGAKVLSRNGPFSEPVSVIFEVVADDRAQTNMGADTVCAVAEPATLPLSIITCRLYHGFVFAGGNHHILEPLHQSVSNFPIRSFASHQVDRFVRVRFQVV